MSGNASKNKSKSCLQSSPKNNDILGNSSEYYADRLSQNWWQNCTNTSGRKSVINENNILDSVTVSTVTELDPQWWAHINQNVSTSKIENKEKSDISADTSIVENESLSLPKKHLLRRRNIQTTENRFFKNLSDTEEWTRKSSRFSQIPHASNTEKQEEKRPSIEINESSESINEKCDVKNNNIDLFSRKIQSKKYRFSRAFESKSTSNSAHPSNISKVVSAETRLNSTPNITEKDYIEQQDNNNQHISEKHDEMEVKKRVFEKRKSFERRKFSQAFIGNIEDNLDNIAIVIEEDYVEEQDNNSQHMSEKRDDDMEVKKGLFRKRKIVKTRKFSQAFTRNTKENLDKTTNVTEEDNVGEVHDDNSLFMSVKDNDEMEVKNRLFHKRKIFEKRKFSQAFTGNIQENLDNATNEVEDNIGEVQNSDSQFISEKHYGEMEVTNRLFQKRKLFEKRKFSQAFTENAEEKVDTSADILPINNKNVTRNSEISHSNRQEDVRSTDTNNSNKIDNEKLLERNEKSSNMIRQPESNKSIFANQDASFVQKQSADELLDNQDLIKEKHMRVVALENKEFSDTCQSKISSHEVSNKCVKEHEREKEVYNKDSITTKFFCKVITVQEIELKKNLFKKDKKVRKFSEAFAENENSEKILHENIQIEDTEKEPENVSHFSIINSPNIPNNTKQILFRRKARRTFNRTSNVGSLERIDEHPTPVTDARKIAPGSEIKARSTNLPEGIVNETFSPQDTVLSQMFETSLISSTKVNINSTKGNEETDKEISNKQQIRINEYEKPNHEQAEKINSEVNGNENISATANDKIPIEEPSKNISKNENTEQLIVTKEKAQVLKKTNNNYTNTKSTNKQPSIKQISIARTKEKELNIIEVENNINHESTGEEIVLQSSEEVSETDAKELNEIYIVDEQSTHKQHSKRTQNIDVDIIKEADLKEKHFVSENKTSTSSSNEKLKLDKRKGSISNVSKKNKSLKKSVSGITTFLNKIEQEKKSNSNFLSSLKNYLRNEAEVTLVETPKLQMKPLTSYFPKINVIKEPFNKSKPIVKNKAVPQALLVDGKPYPRRKLYKAKSWMTPLLYKYLQKKMRKKFKEKTVIESENLMKSIGDAVTVITKSSKYQKREIKNLAKELAKHQIISTMFEFYNFCQDYLPRNFCDKVIPCAQAFTAEPTVPFEPELLHEKIGY